MVTALNPAFLRDLSYVAEDEGMMKKLTRYVHRLLQAKEVDDTCMTKEEFYAMLDEEEKGPTYKKLPGESIDQMLVRLGYV